MQSVSDFSFLIKRNTALVRQEDREMMPAATDSLIYFSITLVSGATESTDIPWEEVVLGDGCHICRACMGAKRWPRPC